MKKISAIGFGMSLIFLGLSASIVISQMTPQTPSETPPMTNENPHEYSQESEPQNISNEEYNIEYCISRAKFWIEAAEQSRFEAKSTYALLSSAWSNLIIAGACK